MIRRTTILAVVLLAGLLGRPAMGQSGPDDQTARQITRVALLDLRNQTEASVEDYEILSALLSIAEELTPDDPDLIRRAIEAHRAAGNEHAVMSATRRLLGVDPDDSVAQLRILSWFISQKQTVDERVALYNRFLGPDGERSIADPAVRSRLALDAALLHREQGDERRFIERLALATRLDSSNKEAATLAAAFYAERSDDPVGRLELAVNVLMSDPIDPNLHFAIAGALASHGAFEQAQRFHDNGRRLIAADGIVGDPDVDTESLILRWHNHGAEAIVGEFESMLQLQREDAQRRIDLLIEQDLPTEGVTPPSEILLPLHTERVRAYAAAAAGDPIVIERSLTDLQATIQPMLEQLSDRMRSPEAQADSRLQGMIAAQAAQLAADVVTTRLIAGVQTREAVTDLGNLRQLFGSEAERQFEVIQALADFREGREDAIDRLAGFADDSVLGSIGYAIALEESGDVEGAVEAYVRPARFSPISPFGAFARTRAERLRGEAIVFTDRTAAMRTVAEAVPQWMDEIAGDPGRFMALRVWLEEPRVGPYEIPPVRVELRNVSGIPLAVGTDRAINSRFMVSPGMSIAAIPVSSQLTPEVVDLHRRLRLEPGESLRLELWPDPGWAGWLAEVKAGHMIRERWNLLQGFVVGRGALYTAGPMCLSGETGLLARDPDLVVRQGIDDIARQADLYEEARLIPLLASIRAALLDPDRPGGALTDADAARLAGVLAGRFPTLSRTAKLACAAMAPSAALRPGMDRLDEAVLADADPAVLVLGLVTRVRSADSPALQRAKSSDDSRLARVAGQLESRLRRGEGKGFAFIESPGSHRPPPPEHEGAVTP